MPGASVGGVQGCPPIPTLALSGKNVLPQLPRVPITTVIKFMRVLKYLYFS